MSWWSTSATAHSNFARTRSLRPRSTWRLPFREPTSGRCSSTIPSATRAADTAMQAARTLQRARHFLGRERLEDVPGLDVVHALHADTALETGEHFPHLVLEPLEGADGPFAQHRLAALDADLRHPHELAFHDVGAADGSELGDVEDLAHLRAPQHRLADLGSEQSGEGGLEVVHGFVDDVVVAHVHAVGLRLARRLRLRLDVEAEHDGAGGGGEHDVRLVDGAHRAVNDLELDLLRGQPLEGVAHRFEGALNVGLEDEAQLLDLARRDLLLQAFERDARGSLALGLFAVRAHVG